MNRLSTDGLSDLTWLVNPTKPRQIFENEPRVSENVLCPDRETLDKFLGGLLYFMNPQTYDVAATFELLPTWLRFLESRGLIQQEQREATLSQLRDMQDRMIKLYESDRTDHALVQNIRRWRESSEAAELASKP